MTYAYNTQGQVTSETHADSSTTTYTYDAQGRVLTQGGTAAPARRMRWAGSMPSRGKMNPQANQ